jgi:hypothetical protein
VGPSLEISDIEVLNHAFEFKGKPSKRMKGIKVALGTIFG